MGIWTAPVFRLASLFESLANGFQQTSAVQHRQYLHALRPHLIDDAIAVQEALANSVIVQFRHPPPRQWVRGDHFAQLEQGCHHPLRVVERISRDERGYGVDVFERFV